MIYIDAREGLSGDMLVAAMLDLLDPKLKKEAGSRIERAATRHAIGYSDSEIEEDGEKGLSINYRLTEPTVTGASYEGAFVQLEDFENHLESHGPTGRLILKTIFKAESEAHDVPVDQVHLHEIGRPQGILNMAAIGMLSHMLLQEGGEGFVASKIVTGKGVTVVSHGAVRIPPPAARILLRGLWHEEGEAAGERATPTGIAALKVLASSQTDMVPLNHFIRKGVGFGSKRFGGRLGRTILYRF
jgi:uncharacterized protein (DUF111 family)